MMVLRAAREHTSSHAEDHLGHLVDLERRRCGNLDQVVRPLTMCSAERHCDIRRDLVAAGLDLYRVENADDSSHEGETPALDVIRDVVIGFDR